jgi:hypothetical protein
MKCIRLIVSPFIDLCIFLSDNKLTHHQMHRHVHIYKIKGNKLKIREQELEYFVLTIDRNI